MTSTPPGTFLYLAIRTTASVFALSCETDRTHNAQRTMTLTAKTTQHAHDETLNHRAASPAKPVSIFALRFLLYCTIHSSARTQGYLTRSARTFILRYDLLPLFWPHKWPRARLWSDSLTPFLTRSLRSSSFVVISSLTGSSVLCDRSPHSSQGVPVC